MINRSIHVLSNQAGPFDLFNLPRNPDFVPRRLTKAQSLVRSLLYLDRGDYYINALLAALQAYPDIEAFIQDNVKSFDPSRRRPSSVQIEGAEFFVDKNIRGLWLDNDQQLPVNLTYTVDYKTSSLVTVRSEDRGDVATVHYTTAGTDPTKIIHINWTDGLPFSGPLRLSQIWTTGSRVVIKVQPSKFPYADLVSRVLGNPYINERMHRLLLQEEFFASEDPIERAAMLALAIVTDDNQQADAELPDERLEHVTTLGGFRCDSTLVTCDNNEVFCDNVS